MLALLLLIVSSVVAHENAQCFPDNTQDAESGVSRICYTDATNKYSIPLINDEVFMKGVTKLNRERLPERVVHAKGSGAYGYFEVTHDISHICNADFLKEVGKKTPVAVRFATGVTERGSSDLGRDTRAMSVKFYTEEGNFDLLGSAKPMFLYKDPLRFTTIIHAAKRRPDSNLFDQNTYWDAISLLPESLNFFLRLYSDEGIPASFRNMAGFAIHTFQVVNKHGDYHFVRFHCIPDDGEKTLTTEEAMTLGAADPDYAIRDLYEKINEGNYPSWTLSVQILKMADVKEHGVSRVFDTTRELPVDKFPLHQVGKIVLNKNAKDFQNEIEKLAFCPCNLVPGIVGSPDKLFEARAQLYKDAQLYRLGKNHNKIPVNCPIHTISTYNRDGMPPLGSNGGNASNYYPNGFGGPQPYDKERNSNKTCKGQGLIKIKENPYADNFDQAAVYYKGLNDARRTILIENLKTPLITVEPFIQKRLLNLFTSIDSDLANRFAEALGITLP